MALTTAERLKMRAQDLREIVEPFDPALRAYILGLLSSTSPKTLSVLISLAIGKLKPRDAAAKLQALFHAQTRLEKFPAVCAILVGGATLLPIPFIKILDRIQETSDRISPLTNIKLVLLTKLACAAIAANISFSLLNRKDARPIDFHSDSARRKSNAALKPADAIHRGPEPAPARLAGRTLDLTLFGVVRAADVILSSFWSAYRKRPKKASGAERAASISEAYVAPSVFAISSTIIMWAWFNSPDRLPRTYNNWITSAAQIDIRLLRALQACRRGEFIYGKETGWNSSLTPMCREKGYPEVWGDPSKTIPIPCELYHSGTGKNCEWHAIVRFFRAFKFSMQMYLPLNLLMLLRRKPASRSIRGAVIGASRSSAFLASFIAFFYYGVCLTRTRIGPKIFPKEYIGPMQIDGGLCVGTGCAVCGLSILIENPARRNEIAFFVAPRALATIFPRRYDRRNLPVERVAFVASAAIIMMAAQVKPDRIRGVFGRLLEQVFVS